MLFKVGIILGSTRTHSNTAGVSRYLESLVSQHNNDKKATLKSNSNSDTINRMEVEVIHLTNSPGHPLPFLVEEPIMAKAHRPRNLSELSELYIDSKIQEWSKTVLQWDGLIIITPQYNWGYPGILKNCLDHLYYEFNKLPLGIITLGGTQGGLKCFEQLKIVCQGALNMNLIDKNVAIKLPKHFIQGENRIKGSYYNNNNNQNQNIDKDEDDNNDVDAQDESWLVEYQEELHVLLEQLVDKMKFRKEEQKR
ncbi:uncharacterized protein L201_006918 [Kwoniella dendrophila CBS 6074]|uniref:NADPH-dependent FMN reductase-like domain-containing protein n=1 Tax=Kwoniella dendrophila CBS 6074 TaxID=1295534 RepID=A0AAX4K589_9TREE